MPEVQVLVWIFLICVNLYNAPLSIVGTDMFARQPRFKRRIMTLSAYLLGPEPVDAAVSYMAPVASIEVARETISAWVAEYLKRHHALNLLPVVHAVPALPMTHFLDTCFRRANLDSLCDFNAVRLLREHSAQTDPCHLEWVGRSLLLIFENPIPS